MFDNSQEDRSFSPVISCKSVPTSTQLQHSSTGLLSVSEAAQMLDKPVMTITRWCKSGKLPALAKAYGSKMTYLINPKMVELLKQKLLETIQVTGESLGQVRPHLEFVDLWIEALTKGTLTGKKYSPITIENYTEYVQWYLKRYATVSTLNVQAALGESGGQYARRFKLYKAVICFAKYLR